jgi:hypothetical protein
MITLADTKTARCCSGQPAWTADTATHCTVWDVLYKRKFQLLQLNCGRNRELNLKAPADTDAMDINTPKRKKSKVSEHFF